MLNFVGDGAWELVVRHVGELQALMWAIDVRCLRGRGSRWEMALRGAVPSVAGMLQFMRGAGECLRCRVRKAGSGRCAPWAVSTGLVSGCVELFIWVPWVAREKLGFDGNCVLVPGLRYGGVLWVVPGMSGQSIRMAVSPES